jgi:hypothetical protein
LMINAARDKLCAARSDFAHCQRILCSYEQVAAQPQGDAEGDAFLARHMIP